MDPSIFLLGVVIDFAELTYCMSAGDVAGALTMGAAIAVTLLVVAIFSQIGDQKCTRS